MILSQSRIILRTLWAMCLLSMALASMQPRPAAAATGFGPTYGVPYQPFVGFAPGFGCQPTLGQMGGMIGGCGGIDPMALNYGINWTTTRPLGLGSYQTNAGLAAFQAEANYASTLQMFGGQSAR